MLKFLEDSQLFFRICGYCTCDPTKNSPRFRWSGITNRILTFLIVYLIVNCFAFVCDQRQPNDERIVAFMSVVAYGEICVGHLTLTAQKLKIYELFNYYEKVINQSKFDI